MQATDQRTQQPTPLARVLTATAARLQRSADLTHPIHGTPEPRCMTRGLLDTTLPSVIGRELPRVPYWDRAGFAATVRATLPPVTGTVAEYAALLRATAVNL